MQKLDPVQISWIVKSKENGANNADVASSMKVSVRWVQKLCSRYRRTRIIPVSGKPGRPKKIITEEMREIVVDAFEKFKCSAVFLDLYLDTLGRKNIFSSMIQKYLNDDMHKGKKSGIMVQYICAFNSFFLYHHAKIPIIFNAKNKHKKNKKLCFTK